MKYLFKGLLLNAIWVTAMLAQVSLPGSFIFTPDKQLHGHTHASSIVECPNGDLIACWYEGEGDKSRDVRIQAARLVHGDNEWSKDFLLADTPMLSDNNPCLFVDDQQRLWLFYYTLLGAPEEPWDTAYLRYKISAQYQDASQPIVWNIQRDLPIIPNELDETIENLCNDKTLVSQSEMTELCARAKAKLKSQLARRLGWTTRVPPVTLSSGTILLPMASEIFGVAAMAITPDGGESWSFTKPIYGYGVEQPTVFERTDGSLVAYFRDFSPAGKIRKSESFDSGLNWTPIVNTEFPNPGAGIAVLRLQNGHVVLIYNDCEDDPRNSLAITMSDDDGKTWKWKRHIERVDGEGRFDYPAVIQSQDGRLHATYSFNLKTIKHVVLNEEWIKAGDQ
jgi:predicted neuraminidase